jgi:hypothetical protein
MPQKSRGDDTGVPHWASANSTFRSTAVMDIFRRPAILSTCRRQSPFTNGSQRNVVYLGWPIAPSYMSPNAGRGGGRGCGVLANEYSCAIVAQINFGDLTPSLTLPCTKREDSVQNSTFLYEAVAQIFWQYNQIVNLETLPTVTEVHNLKTNRYSF